jgi:hypothetical protein
LELGGENAGAGQPPRVLIGSDALFDLRKTLVTDYLKQVMQL